MQRLKNKIALITGGSSGIGKATAELFVQEGAMVFIGDINETDGKLFEEKYLGKLKFMKLDVKEEQDWIECLNAIKAECGRLDVLFNNAGIMGSNDPEHATLEEWELVHAVNLRSVFLGCKYAIGLMKEHGGSIINMSSRSGVVGVKNTAAYSSSKAAVKNYSKSVALYCADKKYNIRCNSVIPAAVLTDIWNESFGENRSKRIQEVSAGIPLGHMGEPIDVAYAVLFLASDESKYITGSEITIDGGILAGSSASPGKQ